MEMIDNYFTYWSDLPEQDAFSVFGPVHMIWLIAEAAFICVGVYIYRKKELCKRRAMRRGIAAAMLVMEVYKDLVLIVTGHMDVQYLPLQLCGLAILVEALYAFAPCAFLGEVMCVLCMPGAAAALIFPDWTRYPVVNFMNLHSFIVHGLLVLMPCMVLASDEYVPKIRRAYMVFAFLIGAAFVDWCVNSLADCNFMFLRWPSANSPFMGIYQTYGYGVYMAVYASVVCLAIFALYGVIYIVSKIDMGTRQVEHD